ncbi:hypothetical protein [Candidatus Bealeia paramacronuclearis]|uniref:hypothetical protein n=1 Tax=Candidatus Bealeia paramacronuclearis TaxID=1921001 RepID=UPI002F2666D4
MFEKHLEMCQQRKVKNFLTPKERASLKVQHRRERDRRICDQIRAVILADEGLKCLQGSLFFVLHASRLDPL